MYHIYSRDLVPMIYAPICTIQYTLYYDKLIHFVLCTNNYNYLNIIIIIIITG